MRRVRDQNPDHKAPDAQGELFPSGGTTPFTNTDLPMLTAEADHRRHAIVEQVIAHLENGPLAHMPSGNFMANSVWLVLAAMAFNLKRAVGSLASAFHAKAATATIRASSSKSGAGQPDAPAEPRCDYPRTGPWATAGEQLFATAFGPPTGS